MSVQIPGYKSVVRDHITLGAGEQVTLPFTLEVGQISEQVVVTTETPLLDTTSLKSAARFDTHLVESLPMFSNMPITLSRFSPSTNVNDQQTQVSQGYVDNTSLSAGSGLGLPLGGTQPTPPSFGGNNGRTWQVRFDAQNVFNRQQWLSPTLNPTSTQFGRVTTVALNQMRFFSFGVRGTF